MDPVITTADPKVQAVIDDAISNIAEVKADLAAYKAGGISGAMQHLPAIIAAVQKNVADVEAAIPVVKAGYKTSEFWIATLSSLLLAALGAFTSLPTSSLVAIASAIGAIVAVYTVVRGLVKSSAAPAK